MNALSDFIIRIDDAVETFTRASEAVPEEKPKPTVKKTTKPKTAKAVKPVKKK
jgi:hypothetical protein